MATVALAQALVDNTKADCDQQHPPVIVDNNSRIPDRTQFLLDTTSEDPRPELIATAKRLENCNVSCIIMPCNTAHAFYKEISESINTPVLHMIEETVRWITEHYPKQKKIGVLATQGTYKANVYKNGLEKFDLTQVKPDKKGQDEVTKMIYDGVKANNFSFDRSGYEQTIKEMREKKGVEVFILGCTELSVVHNEYPLDGIFVDPLQIIAKAAIKFVGADVTCL